MKSLLRAAGNPERTLATVIVAGTNGKGSTAATLASILTAAGYRTGLYTSPHLVDLRERWTIDRIAVSMPGLRRAIRRLRSLVAATSVRPTHFEALTLVAFFLFQDERCDAVVLEAGLGGRLDATNVTSPVAALITSIGIDHREILGNTLRSIAREKGGVIHRGAIVLTSCEDEGIVDTLRRRAGVVRAAAFHRVALETNASAVREEIRRLRFRLVTPEATYRLESPLPGLHQVENIALAVRAAERLVSRFPRIGRDAIRRGVAMTRWRGRLESFELEGKHVVVDGAHNRDAACKVARFIERHLHSPRLLVLGIMRDKEVAAIASALVPLFDSVIVTEPDPLRGAAVSELEAIVASHGLRALAVRDPRAAVRRALRARETTVVVCGSLYLAGAAIGVLDRRSRG